MSEYGVPDFDDSNERGAWVAFYHDLSSVAVFGSELEALRYAISRGMVVKFVEYGKEIG